MLGKDPPSMNAEENMCCSTISGLGEAIELKPTIE